MHWLVLSTLYIVDAQSEKIALAKNHAAGSSNDVRLVQLACYHIVTTALFFSGTAVGANDDDDDVWCIFFGGGGGVLVQRVTIMTCLLWAHTRRTNHTVVPPRIPTSSLGCGQQLAKLALYHSQDVPHTPLMLLHGVLQLHVGAVQRLHLALKRRDSIPQRIASKPVIGGLGANRLFFTLLRVLLRFHSLHTVVMARGCITLL